MPGAVTQNAIFLFIWFDFFFVSAGFAFSSMICSFKNWYFMFLCCMCLSYYNCLSYCFVNVYYMYAWTVQLFMYLLLVIKAPNVILLLWTCRLKIKLIWFDDLIWTWRRITCHHEKGLFIYENKKVNKKVYHSLN